MNDAQTFDHKSPQGDIAFGSEIGLKFTLAFPGAFMQKILPAVLMLCALAAGSQPVCAATDNQLMREEITAGIFPLSGNLNRRVDDIGKKNGLWSFK